MRRSSAGDGNTKYGIYRGSFSAFYPLFTCRTEAGGKRQSKLCVFSHPPILHLFHSPPVKWTATNHHDHFEAESDSPHGDRCILASLHTAPLATEQTFCILHSNTKRDPGCIYTLSCANAYRQGKCSTIQPFCLRLTHSPSSTAPSPPCPPPSSAPQP